MPLGLLRSMASRPLSRSRRCRLQLKVSPREPVKLVVVFTGHTAREPVVMHPRVWDHEVPLVLSQVIQATGRRILHTWVYERQDRNIITVGDKRCRCGAQDKHPVTNIPMFAPNASVPQNSCSARDRNVLTVRGKRFHFAEVLFIPSFTGFCSADSTTFLCRAR